MQRDGEPGRVWQKAAAILMGLLIGVFAAELGLRQAYPALPSLMPLTEGAYTLRPFNWSSMPPQGPAELAQATCPSEGAIRKRTTDPGDPVKVGAHHTAPPLGLTIAGDSIAYGAGVDPDKRYGLLLGMALSSALDRPVRILNTAVPGAGLCDHLDLTLSALRTHTPPDLLVLELFADDLERRAALMVGEGLVLLPERVSWGPGRLLVRKSYLANLGWLALAPASHRMPERMILPEHQRFFKASLRGLVEAYRGAGAEVLIFLLPAAGQPDCPDGPTTTSRCRWFRDDLDLMARLLGEADLPFVDLRALWHGRPDIAIEAEARAFKGKRIDVPIHPNAAGHALLAEALLTPAIEALRVVDGDTPTRPPPVAALTLR